MKAFKVSSSPLLALRRYILRCIGSSCGDVAASKRHARFAAALAVTGLLCEQPAWEVAEAWGQPDTITHNGMSLDFPVGP